MNYVPALFAYRSILLFIVLIGLNLALFAGNMFPPLWIITSIGTAFLFFHFSHNWTKKWASIPEKSFRGKVFTHAMGILLGYVVVSYFFFTFMTGQPFEFYASDSMLYHRLGLQVKDWLFAGEFDFFDKLWFLKTSSKGYVIFLGVIYTLFFDSILAARIVQALIGAWCCVLVYDLAKRNFGDKAARIAAVMVMLAPPLVYYCGMHLKESLMVFLVVGFLNTGDRLVRAHVFRLQDLLLVMLLGGLLIFFRAALAVTMIMSFLVAVLFLSHRVSRTARRLGIFIVLLSGLALLSTTPAFDEAEQYFQHAGSHIDDQMQYYADRTGGNVLAQYGSVAVFLPLTFIGPLPTLTNMGHENLLMLSGALYTRNIIVFFTILAFIAIIKRKVLRQNILLLCALFSWLFVLGNSGFALSDRFHLVIIPIIIIFAGYGVTQINKQNWKYFMFYLFFISVLIIAWNWFKLAGRGMI